MKYTIERLPQSRVAIDVEIEAEQFERAVNQAARSIARNYRIPGFRPGKAPRYIVEARYGRAALYEQAADDLVRQAYQEIVRKGEFEPVGKAELERVNLEPFTFRLVVPVMPTVRLGDYRALRFPLEVAEVGDEDVQRALAHLQAEHTIWKEPAPLRPARRGDRLTVDLTGHCGERLLEERRQVEIEVGDPTLLAGFEALEGAEVGQTVEVHTTLPDDVEDKELAGQPATYAVTVHGIKEPEIPPLDDEFARSFTTEQTLEELRARLRHDLQESAQKMARQKVLDQMLQAIIEGAEVDMPQVLVDQEAESLYEEQEKRLREIKIPMARYLEWIGKTEETFRQEVAEEAPSRLRRYLVLQELIRAEGLAGEPAQVRDRLEQLLLDIATGALAEATPEAALPAPEAAPEQAEAAKAAISVSEAGTAAQTGAEAPPDAALPLAEASEAPPAQEEIADREAAQPAGAAQPTETAPGPAKRTRKKKQPMP